MSFTPSSEQISNWTLHDIDKLNEVAIGEEREH